MVNIKRATSKGGRLTSASDITLSYTLMTSGESPPPQAEAEPWLTMHSFFVFFFVCLFVFADFSQREATREAMMSDENHADSSSLIAP